jgi:hypothetical protein
MTTSAFIGTNPTDNVNFRFARHPTTISKDHWPIYRSRHAGRACAKRGVGCDAIFWISSYPAA